MTSDEIPTIFKGSSKIMNQTNFKRELNIEKIEKMMLENGIISSAEEQDPSSRFEKELNLLAKSMGIDDFANIGSPKKTTSTSSSLRQNDYKSPRNDPRSALKSPGSFNPYSGGAVRNETPKVSFSPE